MSEIFLEPPILDLQVYVPAEGTEKKVQILPQQAVEVLKLVVKSRYSYFESVDAKDIQLFAVSLPLDEVQGITDPTGLTAARELTDPNEASSAAFKILRKDHIQVVAFKSKPRRPTPRMPQELRIGLEEAWKSVYQGTAHQILRDNILRDPAREGSYGRTGSIIQSSGYGKSRTVDEFAKLVFTIPINLRNEAETAQGAYPNPDKELANWMKYTAKITNTDQREARLHNILGALFNRITEELDDMGLKTESDLKPEDFATRWREHLLQGDKRSRLYACATLDAGNQSCSLQEAREAAKASLQLLISRVPSTKADNGIPLSVVIYIDEAHELDVMEDGFTLYNLLIMAVADYDKKFFIIFLSTVSRMRQLAPEIEVTRSNRKILSDDLVAPYTEMPFDCHPDLPLQPGRLYLTDVQKLAFLLQFGRPLFWSMFKASLLASPAADHEAKTLIFALQKLINLPISAVSELTPLAKLAVLDTIFNLEYRPFRASIWLTEEMIASYMRTVYSAPRHRQYLHTGHSSEPALADAAMQALHKNEENMADAAASFFNFLDNGITKGAIDMGQRGENIAKMLLIRAYMSAVKAEQGGSEPKWSYGCSLVRFLKCLTGKNSRRVVLGCTPDNLPNGKTLQKAFEKSWVRFTHFGRAADDGAISTSASCAAFFRAMAFIGWTSQVAVDVCIPILLDSTQPIIEANMSAILVQIKLRSTTGSYDIDAETIQFFPPSKSPRDYHETTMDKELAENYFKRHYVLLVMELGVDKRHETVPALVKKQLDQKPAPSTTSKSSPSEPFIGVTVGESPSRSSSRNDTPIHPRFSLRFYGCTSEVYGCISERTEKLYRKLLQLSDMIPDHPHPSSISAVLQMKPFWRTNSDSYGWINDAWLQGHRREDSSEEGRARVLEEKVQEPVSVDEQQTSNMVVDSP